MQYPAPLGNAINEKAGDSRHLIQNIERVGFDSVFYFSRVFKARTGASPRSFIER